jgi:NAD(P)-dependent dehydrogenase (short-subunit alcohol dehydrogenase family)
MPRTAVVAGVGPGLGESLARKFASEGFAVGLFARSADYLDALEADLRDAGHDAVGVQVDLADPAQVERGFDRVRDELGPVDVLVNHASGGAWKGLRDLSREEFDRALRVNAHGALYCSREAVTDMLDGDGGDGRGEDTGGDAGSDDAKRGTIIFTGATSAVRGRGGALGFSAAKFAARGMAESMARELGPEGVHVAHVVIDGQILPPDGPAPGRDREEYLDPDDIAESYWRLVEQDPSAWTLELDLRPHVEEF